MWTVIEPKKENMEGCIQGEECLFRMSIQKPQSLSEAVILAGAKTWSGCG